MADLLGESSPQEGNFDNDFEKLDPESTTPAGDEHSEVTSTSHIQADVPEDDMYRTDPAQTAEAEPLIDIGEPSPAPSAPLIPDLPSQPVSSSTVDKTEPIDDNDITKYIVRTTDYSPDPPIIPPQPVSSSPVEKAEPTPQSTHQPITKYIIEKTDELKKSVDPRVLDLIYWRDVKKTGVVFGSLLVVLLSLALFSVLSVIAYLSLAALTVTVSFRIYKNVLGAVQKMAEGHPFKEYLDADISLPEDKVHHVADCVMSHGSAVLRELRRLFLVEDMIDSFKFGLLLWVLTYIGAWFNGMTLVILAVVTVFTIPKVYETHKAQIDQYIDIVTKRVTDVTKQIWEKIPMPGKKKSA
ncbi:hypothetical protein LSH36_177g04082 [Paralvinella palmiformis]|uniref:Reticulon-like protein n=1 Tax=Paralvinella palmiformis TaxID=53620 RepID=A0AAD9N7Q5_9ANNE|nr:hypothetical protein LSH36_177g04082 [Paralvinella palmiformis]